MTETLAPPPDLLRRQAWVAGEWVDADSGQTFAVTNPATGEEIAQVPRLGAAETRRALVAAEAAYPGWREGKTTKVLSCLYRKRRGPSQNFGTGKLLIDCRELACRVTSGL